MKASITICVYEARIGVDLQRAVQRVLEPLLEGATKAGVCIRLKVGGSSCFILGDERDPASAFIEVVYIDAPADAKRIGPEERQYRASYTALVHEIASALCDQLQIEVHKIPRPNSEVLRPEEGETDR